MKFLTLPRNRFTRPRVVSLFSVAVLFLSLTAFSQINRAQEVQLSLADILIGLRSKKVTLDERNKILADAVKTRGITFSLTPEIESELETGGADTELLGAIKSKSVKIIKVAATPLPTPIPTPVPVAVATPIPTPIPAPTPGFEFYLTRADENNFKGDFDLAITDYNKAVELSPKEISIYMHRGRAFSNKKNFDAAIADFSKVIELNPQDSSAYFNRADTYEKKGDTTQAAADYQKAVDLDATNEAAKSNLKRILDAQQAKLAAETKKPEPPPVVEEQPKPQPAPTTDTAPKTVELGQLNDIALKLAMPVYPDIAKKMNAQGKVTVQITLDEEGKVTSAKAINGNSLLRGAGEDAARRSKFKPTLVGTQAVKATGFIVYNFVDNQ